MSAPGDIRRPGLWQDARREVLDPIEDRLLARAAILAERCRWVVLGEHRAVMDSLPRGWVMTMPNITIILEPGLGRHADNPRRDLLRMQFGGREPLSKPCPVGAHDVGADPELLERVEALAAAWGDYDEAHTTLAREVDGLRSEAAIIECLPDLVRERFAELVDARQAARDRGEEVRP